MKMISLISCIVVSTLAASTMATSVLCESLWTDQKEPLYADLRAAKAGDIVTVLVVESATSTQKATTDTSRNSKFDVGPGLGKIFNNIPAVGYGGTSTSKGEGTTARQSNLITKITATITDVLPSGNLVIKGERDIKTNEENQKVTLTGVIRPNDIAPDNTIASTSIADAKIELTGQGPIGARQKEGIFTRIIRFLF